MSKKHWFSLLGRALRLLEERESGESGIKDSLFRLAYNGEGS